MKLLWITDPHFDYLVRGGSAAFARYLKRDQPFDAVVLTGDIAESYSLHENLYEFAYALGRPVYFVLGNHDYYGGSIARVRQIAGRLGQLDGLTWLDRSEPVLLDETTALVGVGGWADVECGDPMDPDFVMRDWIAIKDFRELTSADELKAGVRQPLINKTRNLAKPAVRIARKSLEAALKLRENVFFATHYPPFREACWHEGGISGSPWDSWFTCITMGEMLADVAKAHPEARITVLCGHTHSRGFYQHSANLAVFTGIAKYRAPSVSAIFEPPIEWRSV